MNMRAAGMLVVVLWGSLSVRVASLLPFLSNKSGLRLHKHLDRRGQIEQPLQRKFEPARTLLRSTSESPLRRPPSGAHVTGGGSLAAEKSRIVTLAAGQLNKRTMPKENRSSLRSDRSISSLVVLDAAGKVTHEGQYSKSFMQVSAHAMASQVKSADGDAHERDHRDSVSHLRPKNFEGHDAKTKYDIHAFWAQWPEIDFASEFANETLIGGFHQNPVFKAIAKGPVLFTKAGQVQDTLNSEVILKFFGLDDSSENGETACASINLLRERVKPELRNHCGHCFGYQAVGKSGQSFVVMKRLNGVDIIKLGMRNGFPPALSGVILSQVIGWIAALRDARMYFNPLEFNPAQFLLDMQEGIPTLQLVDTDIAEDVPDDEGGDAKLDDALVRQTRQLFVYLIMYACIGRGRKDEVQHFLHWMRVNDAGPRPFIGDPIKMQNSLGNLPETCSHGIIQSQSYMELISKVINGMNRQELQAFQVEASTVMKNSDHVSDGEAASK